jgi:hypothetical protein
MTQELEKRIADLEAWRESVEPHVSQMIPLGPRPKRDQEFEERRKAAFQKIVDEIKARQAPPVDRSAQQLVSGASVPKDQSHTKLKDNGQQQDYVVLTAEERTKGFVRPVRESYVHVGSVGPQNPLRDLTEEEQQRYDRLGYVKYEQYPGEVDICNGRYWTQKQLDAKGCGTVTTMSSELAETYARDPKFYGGTFCCGCGKHLPVDEFVWAGTNERVGS